MVSRPTPWDSEETTMIKTHGVFQLRCGRMATDYRPSERGPGMLALRLEVEYDDRRVEGHIRLDPWIGDEYGLIEFRAGNCLLVCGAQAVVAVDASDLTFRSCSAWSTRRKRRSTCRGIRRARRAGCSFWLRSAGSGASTTVARFGGHGPAPPASRTAGYRASQSSRTTVFVFHCESPPVNSSSSFGSATAFPPTETHRAAERSRSAAGFVPRPPTTGDCRAGLRRASAEACSQRAAQSAMRCSCTRTASRTAPLAELASRRKRVAEWGAEGGLRNEV